jgi:signal transduction histidine kinase
VATLVAQGASSGDLFAVVAEQVASVLRVPLVSIARYEADGTATECASLSEGGELFPVGTRWSLDGANVLAHVREAGRPARIDDYSGLEGLIAETVRRAGIRSTVGIPIVVAGRLWGAMVVSSAEIEPLPEDTEARLTDFTELLATAIANAESRAGLARLADEQAALRRVATLVARGAPPEEVFAAVTEEVGRVLPVDFANMYRYEPDRTITSVAIWGRAGERYPVGSRRSLGGQNLGAIVFETGRPARIESCADASGPLSITAREAGVRSAVGTPITVEGRLWGMIGAGSSLEALPPDTEARLASFTQLVATAIANAESRAALAASRARIVAAADETRRRIERDLHDGTQQRLVSIMLDLRAAEVTEPSGLDELRTQLARTAQGLGGVLEELREISRGIHPAILSEGGLEPALRALARRSALPVELDLHAKRRLPEQVEVAAYYVVSEALTNATKHAHASAVHVELDAHNATVQLAIRDDGIGGADPRHGSGLVGLSDRIEALGGTLQVTSPPGSGTTLLIEIPVEGQSNAGVPEP